MFSPDRQFFISACEMDKCVFKWKITLDEDRIYTMIEDELNRNNAELAQAFWDTIWIKLNLIDSSIFLKLAGLHSWC